MPPLPRSMEDDLEPGAEATPGLPLAETGLSDKVVLRFGGASKEKPGGLDDFTVGVGEVLRGGALLETIDGPVGVEGLRVGVAGLDRGFLEGAEDG